jgi:hypothetical protein
MIRNTSNAVPQVTTAKVEPAAMFAAVINAAKVTHTAALGLVYSACAFLFIVNHFREAGADGYMSKADAIEYLKKEIEKQANVKNGMLNLYVRNAGELYSKIAGSAKMFLPVLQRMGTAETPDKVTSILSDWVTEQKGVKSFSEMSQMLGFSTGRAKSGTGGELTPEKAVDRATNTMTALEKFVEEGGMSEATLAQAVVLKAKSPIIFAREAINRVTDESSLDGLLAHIEKHRAKLAKLSADAKAALAKGPAKVTDKHKALATKIKGANKARAERATA